MVRQVQEGVRSRQGKAREDWLKGALRFWALKDLYILGRLLGYDDPRHVWDPIHLWLCDHINEWEQIEGAQVAIFQARGTFKTAIEEIQFIRAILRNPNIRIGIGSWKLEVATAISINVRRGLEHPWTRFLFPEIVPPSPDDVPKWTQHEFTVLRDSASKDPTVYAYSIESMPTSRHFDLNGVDDAIERSSTETEEAIEKAHNALKDLRNLRAGPKAQIWVRGTFWDPLDWHVAIYEGKVGGFRVQRHPARVDEAYRKEGNPLGLPEGALLFPSHKTEEVLQGDLDAMGAWHFATQNQLTIPSALGAAWSESLVKRYYDWQDLQPPYNAYIIFDPATESGDDMHAVLLGLILPGRKFYLVKGFVGHAAPTWVASYIFDLYEEWGGFGIFEEISMAEYFESILKTEAEKRKYMLPHKAIKKRTKKKFDRIWKLDAPLRDGIVFTRDPLTVEDPQDKHFFTVYEHQATRYPNVKHDDVLDTVADLVTEAAQVYDEEVRTATDSRPTEEAQPEFSYRLGF